MSQIERLYWLDSEIRSGRFPNADAVTHEFPVTRRTAFDDRNRKYLRRYLPRIQNSVFEGELTEAKLAAMKSGLSKIIVPERDAVLLWVLREARWAERQVLGQEKLPVSNFL